MLKAKLSVAEYDKLDEVLKKEYALGDDSMYGIVLDKDIGNLERAYQRTKVELKAEKERNETLSAELDTFSSDEKRKMQDITKLQKAHNDELAKLKEQTETYKSQLTKTKIDIATSSLCDTLINPDYKAVAEEILRNKLKLDEDKLFYGDTDISNFKDNKEIKELFTNDPIFSKLVVSGNAKQTEIATVKLTGAKNPTNSIDNFSNLSMDDKIAKIESLSQFNKQ